jgi:hypothetical protein
MYWNLYTKFCTKTLDQMEQLTQFVSKSFEPGLCANNRSGPIVEETSANHARPEWGPVAPSGLTVSQLQRKPSPLSPCPDTTGSSSIGGEQPPSRGSSVSPVVDPDDSRSSPGSGGNPLLLNSPGTEPQSPEGGTEERPGGGSAAGNRTVLTTKEENKSGMARHSVWELFLQGSWIRYDLFIHSPMVLQPFFGPWPLFFQSVGLHWRGISSYKATTYTYNINTEKLT